MKVFITGHKGFLGSAFLKAYGDKYDIVGFDFQDGQDLLVRGSIKEKMAGCEQVVHLAAIPAPVEGKSLQDYMDTNVQATHNVAEVASELGLKRVIYASSTTYYGIERGIPFNHPITESQPVLSQYMSADELACREIDLSYHVSKVMAEQVMAWYGLNKKIQTATLRFGPINKVFFGTSISLENATQAIDKSLSYEGELWYEPFSIVDDRAKHIDNSKAKEILGCSFADPDYTSEQIRSELQ